MIGSLLGKDPNEWQYSIHPDDRERYMREWTEGIMGEIDTEVRVLHTASKPGSEPEDPDALASCWVHIRCGPTFDTDGNVVFISGSMQDIGDRRAREDLLIQRTSDAEMMQRRQEYFIDMISHEVRMLWKADNPITRRFTICFEASKSFGSDRPYLGQRAVPSTRTDQSDTGQ
jgi:hypothetical protein